MRNSMIVKPKTLSNDIRINENFFNNNLKSLSTSNKNNQNSNFKFDIKSRACNKIEVFSERSPKPKNSIKANINQSNNNYKNNNNINLTNRNSFSSKIFIEIFNNTKKNSYTINNLSKSTNFNPIKYADPRSKTKININPKNFSSTFSNFFRKSSANINGNLSENIRDIQANGKNKYNFILILNKFYLTISNILPRFVIIFQSKY